MDIGLTTKVSGNTGDLVLASNLAERVGFEPTIPEDIPVFETGAFVRSAISPQSHSISQAAWRFKVTVASTPPGRGLKETLPVL